MSPLNSTTRAAALISRAERWFIPPFMNPKLDFNKARASRHPAERASLLVLLDQPIPHHLALACATMRITPVVSRGHLLKAT